MLFLYVTHLTLNTLYNASTQADRSHQKLAIATLVRVASQCVEQVRSIRANVLQAGEEAEVLIDTRSGGVIVPSAEVNIAA